MKKGKARRSFLCGAASSEVRADGAGAVENCSDWHLVRMEMPYAVWVARHNCTLTMTGARNMREKHSLRPTAEKVPRFNCTLTVLFRP